MSSGEHKNSLVSTAPWWRQEGLWERVTQDCITKAPKVPRHWVSVTNSACSISILTTLRVHWVLQVNSKSSQACVSQLLLAVGARSGRPMHADKVASRRAGEWLSSEEDLMLLQRTWVRFSATLGGSLPPITPVPGDPGPSSGLPRYQACTQYKDMHEGKTFVCVKFF